jgi:hypothetical protein
MDGIGIGYARAVGSTQLLLPRDLVLPARWECAPATRLFSPDLTLLARDHGLNATVVGSAKQPAASHLQKTHVSIYYLQTRDASRLNDDADPATDPNGTNVWMMLLVIQVSNSRCPQLPNAPNY